MTVQAYAGDVSRPSPTRRLIQTASGKASGKQLCLPTLQNMHLCLSLDNNGTEHMHHDASGMWPTCLLCKSVWVHFASLHA